MNSAGSGGNRRRVERATSSRASRPESDSIPFEYGPTVTPIPATAAFQRAAVALSVESAHLLAWALVAVVSFAVTTMHDGPLATDLRTRLFRHFYGAGQLLAAGVVTGGAARVFHARVSRSPVAAAVATLVAAFTLGWTIVKNDYAMLTNRLAYIAPPILWRVLFTLACALAIPLALLVGRSLSHGPARVFTLGTTGFHGRSAPAWQLRWLGVFGGLAAFVFARTAYPWLSIPGTRLLLAIASAVLVGASLEGARPPAVMADLLARSAVARRLPWALCALWGAYAVLITPPAPVLFHLLQPPAAVIAPIIAELQAPGLLARRTADEVKASLSADPPVAPSGRALLPADGAVILLTIDCLRADVLSGDVHEAELPNLIALRRGAASFTQARSGGNMTSVALMSLFSGRYESQVAWTETQTAHTRYLLPSEDPAPRFPELLSAAKVATVAVSGIEWMDARGGILRGFAEEQKLGPASGGVAKGEDLMSAAIERIERAEGATFLFVHLLDAHDPYDRAGTQGSERERYLRELALVDREVGRLVAAIDKRFGERAILIVSADHGEAFNEHGTSRHGHNVYDEVVHVPLLVRGKDVKPRAIRDSVSTMDLGPTVLDLFRLPVPATFMGQSLVPALAGESVARRRPVAVETPGYEAVIEGGWKTTRRKRYGTVELYHLDTDPGETTNVFREGDADAAARLRAMDSFFEEVRTR